MRQLDISCANANYFKTSGLVLRKIRKSWPYFLMGGASLTHQQAIKEVEDGLLDMVTWGRHILANPGFISKLKMHFGHITYLRPMAAFVVTA